MRIVGGQARGRPLRAPPGNATRPTSDRVREALFDILGARPDGLEQQVVLDLYAGSGALGLEALSRGAARAVFVERDPRCMRVLQDNARRVGLDQRCTFLCLRVEAAIGVLERRGSVVQLALADPPYARDVTPVLTRIGRSAVLESGATCVVEHGRGRAPPATAGALRLVDARRYGDSALAFYRVHKPSNEMELADNGSG